MSAPRTVVLLSGPNLNLLGQREPAIYGTATLEDHASTLRAVLAPADITVEHVQSNHEGTLIDAVHAARGRAAAIVINPGAFTHYGWGLHDALAAFEAPIVELHLSNPQRRERWRHTSVVAPVATAMICGLGGAGYRLAGLAVLGLLGLDERSLDAPSSSSPSPSSPSPSAPAQPAEHADVDRSERR